MYYNNQELEIPQCSAPCSYDAFVRAFALIFAVVSLISQKSISTDIADAASLCHANTIKRNLQGAEDTFDMFYTPH